MYALNDILMNYAHIHVEGGATEAYGSLCVSLCPLPAF